MMKSIKILLILALMVGIGWTAQANKVKIYPRYGTVIVKVHNPKVIIHGGVNFYYAKGVWYKPRGRKYVVCRAPIGVRVKYIPRGYNIVRVNGKKYYTFNGIWYTKKRGYYTVVKVS